MDDQLLIRAFNVGLGDCIYCRIPQAIKIDGKIDDFHLLIDCGSWGKEELLTAATTELAKLLPELPDKRRRLDLLVVTHQHKDHIAGFDPDVFAKFRIGALWMSTAMNPNRDRPSKALGLVDLAGRAMQSLAALNLSLDQETAAFVESFAVNNNTALTTLHNAIPMQSGIKPHYVHAGQTHADLGLELVDTEIHVLGPEEDLDHYYLGKPVAAMARKLQLGFAEPETYTAAATTLAPESLPANISASDFRRLRGNMLSNALALAAISNQILNNTSVVLLIEWNDKRLLFVGDAEWDGAFREDRANGSWNVMWHRQREKLGKPLDFLKIGHHGSENATPWNQSNNAQRSEALDILDAILPIPAGGIAPTAQAFASTQRGRYPTIPRNELLAELGRRVRSSSTRIYQVEFANAQKTMPIREGSEDCKKLENQAIEKAQPIRTDFEIALGRGSHVDILI